MLLPPRELRSVLPRSRPGAEYWGRETGFVDFIRLDASGLVIFPKQASKQHNSSVWRAPLCPPLAPARRFWLEDSLPKLRYRDAVNYQKPPQASILLAETNIFLLRRFEWKRV
jgi:hypothetical protein